MAVFLVFVFALAFLVQPYRIEGTSMYPELGHRDVVLVDKVTYRMRGIRRGDVILFVQPGGDGPMVKRVIGVPGDTVAMNHGTVLVNGQTMRQPEMSEDCASTASFDPVPLRLFQYFVLGDCRKSSLDSRSIGPVPAKAIVGRAFMSIWPPEAFLTSH